MRLQTASGSLLRQKHGESAVHKHSMSPPPQSWQGFSRMESAQVAGFCAPSAPLPEQARPKNMVVIAIATRIDRIFPTSWSQSPCNRCAGRERWRTAGCGLRGPTKGGGEDDALEEGRWRGGAALHEAITT